MSWSAGSVGRRRTVLPPSEILDEEKKTTTLFLKETWSIRSLSTRSRTYGSTDRCSGRRRRWDIRPELKLKPPTFWFLSRAAIRVGVLRRSRYAVVVEIDWTRDTEAFGTNGAACRASSGRAGWIRVRRRCVRPTRLHGNVRRSHDRHRHADPPQLWWCGRLFVFFAARRRVQLLTSQCFPLLKFLATQDLICPVVVPISSICHERPLSNYSNRPPRLQRHCCRGLAALSGASESLPDPKGSDQKDSTLQKKVNTNQPATNAWLDSTALIHHTMNDERNVSDGVE